MCVCVCVCACVRVCAGVRVCLRGVCLHTRPPELTDAPLLCFKSFARVASYHHRARSDHSHAAATVYPRPRPPSALQVSPCVLPQTLFLLPAEPQHALALKLPSRWIKSWPCGVSWRMVLSVCSWTDGWTACANCCLCLLPLSVTAHEAAEDFPGTKRAGALLSACVIHSGFSSVNHFLDVFDAFYLEMTINFTLLLFFLVVVVFFIYEYIYTG